DYVTDVVDGRSCKRVNKCSNDGCDGEDVTRITRVEGIPASTLPSLSSITASIFNGTYSIKPMGGVLPYHALEYEGAIIGGRKFLDLCGVQVAQVQSPTDWISLALGKCNEIQPEIEGVYDDFLGLVN
ncbi:MAG: hypothetical protein KC493_16900, partial [Bacteriovoracaceae bacterium]|nr:hypothetical protein [Bacteriovoracaceae bacterium]